MMKKLILILSCLFLSVGLIYAQKTITATGTVVDETGMEVVGAAVLLKGTTTGVATDIDGKFSLNVPENSTLVFSLVGMQSVEMKAAANMNVILESDEALLDEVVVVAYGTAKKSQFTGSATAINADKISKRAVSNVTNALSGQLAGVQVSNTGGGQPGTIATIRIRGVGSMGSSNDPLYVVDGVPLNKEVVVSLNPSDIESMTVLKDAAANAIYGARGSNGVVMITTKKGKTEKASVTLDMKWGSNKRAIPKYDVMDNPAQYYETYYRALYNSQIYGGKNSEAAYAYANNNLTAKAGLGYNVYSLPQGQNLIGSDFKINPEAKLGYSDGTYYFTPDDWYDEIFGSGNLRQEYNASISGMSGGTNYYLSLGYLDDTGIIPNSGFSRYTGRANIETQAKSWLRVGGNIGYTYFNQKSPGAQTDWGSTGNVFAVSDYIAPIYPLYVRNADGSIMKDDRGLTVYDFGNNTSNVRPYSTPSNPAAQIALNDYNRNTDVVDVKGFATITPITGLSLTANLGVNSYNQRRNDLYNPFYGSAAGDTGGQVYVAHTRDFSINQQYLATYAFTLQQKHNIDILAGFESYTLNKQFMDMSNRKIYNPYVGEIGNAIGTTPDIDSYTDKYTTQGFLSRVQYNYDGKYFLSGSYRRDGSSRFHKDNRWGNFGSVGGAWLITEENFMENVSWVDMLKFKASYGIQGNDNLLTPDLLTNFYPYADQFEIGESNGDFSLIKTYVGNTDITWETSYAFNTGFDFELLDRRLNGTIEYFRRLTDDLLYYQPQPLTNGFAYKPMNVGEVLNHGVELELTGVAFRNKDAQISLFANATHVSNEIKELHPSTYETGGIKGGNYIYRVGGSLYDSYMRRYAGVDKETGKALYYVDPDNGDWSTTDEYINAKQSDLGSTLPKVYGGFGLSAEAYGFDLYIQLAYQLGGRLYDGTYEYLMHVGDNKGTNWHKDVLNSWTPENPNSDIPRLSTGDISNQRQSDRFLVSSNYLSLNSVVLGYTLPKKLLRSLGMSSIRVYVSGDNLALLSKRKGFDPRTSLGLGSSTSSGSFKYSALRNFSGGVSVTF